MKKPFTIKRAINWNKINNSNSAALYYFAKGTLTFRGFERALGTEARKELKKLLAHYTPSERRALAKSAANRRGLLV